MSSKKTSPMWTEVKDVTRLKVGDLIIWPKETGRVKHLRGSVSTLRKLGFTVGKGRILSHPRAKFLLAHPEETKVYIVTHAQPDAIATDLADINSIKPCNDCIVRYVDACILPLNMAANMEPSVTPYKFMTYWSSDQASTVMTKNMLGKISDYLGAHPADRHIGESIQRILRYSDAPVSDVPTKFVSCSNMSTMTSVLEILGSCADNYDDSTIIRMSAASLINTTSRGVKIIRPSPKMNEAILASIVSHVNDCVVSHCVQLDKAIRLAIDYVKEYKKRVIKCVSNARSASKRNVNTARPVLTKLTEFVSSLPAKTKRRENEIQHIPHSW